MFRNPLYLNVHLLRSLADYHGYDLPGDREVTRRTRDESRRRAGVDKVINVGGEGEKEDEVTERYSLEFRPVRALNDVVDRLLREEAVVDLTTDENQAVLRRSIIQAEGELELSPVTEVGAFVSAFVPSMVEQMAAGREEPEFDPAIMGQMFLGGAPAAAMHVFTMDVQAYHFIVLVDPKHLHEDATMDDLEGEFTLLATVDRIIPEGASKSLDRYLMPTMNRATRRMFGGKTLIEMVESLGDVLGNEIDPDALTVSGPAMIVTPVGIY